MRLKDGVIIQEMGNEYVAYDNDTGEFHELNEVAYIILKGISEGKSKKSIVKMIGEGFKVDTKKAEDDYGDFLKILKDKSLIVVKK